MAFSKVDIMWSKMFLPKTRFHEEKSKKKRGGGWEGCGKIRGTYKMYVSDTVGRKSKRIGQYLGKSSKFHEFPLLHTRSLRVLNPRPEEQTGEKFPS